MKGNRPSTGQSSLPRVCVAIIVLLVLSASCPAGPAMPLGVVFSRAQAEGTAQEPTGGPPPGAPRSRLTVSGRYDVNMYNQKNFFLGSSSDSLRPGFSDKDAFVTQELTLFPRIILADNLNLNLRLAVAQAIWGWNLDEPDTTTHRTTDPYFRRHVENRFRVDWAFLSYRNNWSGTRWYLGRQKFGPGYLLVLDEDAPGLQMYKDFPQMHSALGVGYAKQTEWSRILRGGSPSPPGSDLPRPGDADLFIFDWSYKPSDRLSLNPFYISYKDRSKPAQVDSVFQTGTNYLPDNEGFLDARFRPQISEATVIGLAGSLHRGGLELKFEYDRLKGKDKINNQDFGPLAIHDVNDGDLTGHNLYVDLTLAARALELGGAVAVGSGDEDARRGDGNFNYLRNQGHFSLTEVWGNGLELDERGIAPQGLGNPYVRGYRGLENTRIFQGRAAYQLLPSVRLAASYSIIRAVIDVKAFHADSLTGMVTTATWGYASSTGSFEANPELGKEIDIRADWSFAQDAVLSLRGGFFQPGLGAAYLINGYKTYQKSASQFRLSVTVPIREFSLGG